MKKALLTGINFFGTSSELAGCMNDINNMEEYLLSHGFETQNIHKLYDIRQKNVVNPSNPTTENIMKGLRWVRDSGDGGFSYVHYSSHGSQIRDRDGDEVDGRDEVVCTVDGFISDDVLHKVLVQELPKNVKLRAVFDTCHSGTMLDLPCRWSRGQRVTTEKFAPGLDEKDIIMISGCMDNQTSADAWISQTQRTEGAMSWSLLNTLEWAEKYDTDITWKDLVQKMRFTLKEGGYSQIPQLNMCSRLQMRDSVFDDFGFTK